MKFKSNIPFSDGSVRTVERGDIILTDEGKFIFLEVRKTRWGAKSLVDGKNWTMPIYRLKGRNHPVCIDIVGKSRAYSMLTIDPDDLEFGQAFIILEDPNPLYINLGEWDDEDRIKAVCIGSDMPYNIHKGFSFHPVNIEDRKLAILKDAMDKMRNMLG